MELQVAFWYTKKEDIYIPEFIDIQELSMWIMYFNALGFNVLIPKNVMKSKTIYIDDKMFTL